MTSTCLFQSGQRSRKSFGACKTCTHVSSQRISILTLNFNTYFVGHLANVATLEYFTFTVFFSVFVERCSRVWFGCIERYTWLGVLARTQVFPGHGMYSSGLRGNSRVLGIVVVWSTAVEYAENVALSISVSLSPFDSACLSQCFWNDTEKISMSLRKC